MILGFGGESMEKKNILARLRQTYVEKRLELLKRSYEEWEKTEDDFLKALTVNKDLTEVEAEIEKLVRVRQGIESRVRQEVGHDVLYNEFVDKAERKLLDYYLRAFNAVKIYKDDEKKKYSIVKEFGKRRVF
jgi:hypothetical protein